MDAYMSMLALFPTSGYFSNGVKNWMPCKGQLPQVSQYSPLYSLLGTEFGGDGHTTFALPNLVDKAPKGFQYLICVQGLWPSRPD